MRTFASLIFGLAMLFAASERASAETPPAEPPGELPPGDPPPAPVLLPEDPDALAAEELAAEEPPVSPPSQAAPLAAPAPNATLPAPEVTPPTIVETTEISYLFRGVLAGATGAAVGAALGTTLLTYGALTPGTPEILLLVVGAAMPAFSAFFGGAAAIAFVLSQPKAEDWGQVAACTAFGCLAFGGIFLGIGGASVGCGPLANPCSPAPPGESRIVYASAGSGIGAAVGLGVGALVGLAMTQTPPPGINPTVTLALTAGGVSLLGAAIGGGIGGGFVGAAEEENATALKQRALLKERRELREGPPPTMVPKSGFH